jgi:aspartate aminotransferase-like enzyme
LAGVFNIKIAGGLGILQNKIFRIGHMSPHLSEKDIDEVVNALASFKP